MKIPPWAVGVICAIFSFAVVGIPLYNRGVSFPICFLAQLGTMAGLIFIYNLLYEIRSYRAIDGKPYIKHGLLGKWIELEEHMKEDHKE